MTSPISGYLVPARPAAVLPPRRDFIDRPANPAKARLTDALHRALDRPQRTPAQRAVRRYECIKAIAGALVDEHGCCMAEGADAVREAIEPGTEAVSALGPANVRLIRERLNQLADDPSLAGRIDAISKIRPVHESVLPWVRPDSRDLSGATPRDLGIAAVCALMDVVRQPDDVGNCWAVHKRIEEHETAPHKVLDALSGMLQSGVDETSRLPVGDPIGWKAKLPLGKISLYVLMNRCPAYSKLAEVLKMNELDLAPSLNKASTAARKAALPADRKKFVTVGELLESVARERHGLSRKELKFARIREATDAPIDASASEAAGKLAAMRQTVDAMRTAMAATERSVPLAAWATTVPEDGQDAHGVRCLQAVCNALRSSAPDRSPDSAIETFAKAFRREVQFVLSRADPGKRRLFSLTLRSGGIGAPRRTVRSPEDFRAVMLELVERAGARRDIRRDDYEWLRGAIKARDFPRSVQELFVPATEASGTGAFVPWSFDARPTFLCEGIALLRSESRPSINPIAVRVGDAYVGLQPKLSAARFREFRNLEGWLDLMKLIGTSETYGREFTQFAAHKPLSALSGGHAFRLLPHHESWIDGWSDPRSSPTSAEWITTNVIDPAVARGRTRLDAGSMKSLIVDLLANVPLDARTKADTIAKNVIATCDAARLYNERKEGRRRYRVDKVVHELALMLDDDTLCTVPRDVMRDRLAAAIQMHPQMGRGMAIIADTNWRDGKGYGKSSPMEPLLAGFGYDILAKRVRQWILLEREPGAHSNRVRWCEPFGTRDGMLS